MVFFSNQGPVATQLLALAIVFPSRVETRRETGHKVA